MRSITLQEMSVDQLVQRFESLGVDQGRALLFDEIAKFNRLFDQLELVEGELKTRPGDQRRSLLVLYRHPDRQVQLTAAKATLAVAPAEARAQLRTISDSREYPQAGDAGMTLWALDEGIFKPT